MTAFVTDLPLEEPARFNPAQLEDLCNRIGETRAETEVALALTRISTHLDSMDYGQRGAADDTLRGLLMDVVQDAELIGMSSLAQVAQDVLICDTRGDVVAFAATMARLRRIGDRSIHAVWDFDDVSG